MDDNKINSEFLTDENSDFSEETVREAYINDFTDDASPDDDFADENSGNRLEDFISRVSELWDSFSEQTCQRYAHPDEKKIIPFKNAMIIFGSCVAGFVLLAVALYFGLTSKTLFHNTGITPEDFIERFNSINTVSDSSVYLYIPSYTDILIPEDAELGKKPVELMDGHIVIEADTRFGKIVSLTMRTVELPGYNYDTYQFEAVNTGELSNVPSYFCICLGKACYAAGYDNIDGIISALYAGYTIYGNSYMSMTYYKDGITTLSVDEGNQLFFNIEDCTLYFEPVPAATASWPEWLTSCNSGSKRDNNSSEDTQQEEPSQDVITSQSDGK